MDITDQDRYEIMMAADVRFDASRPVRKAVKALQVPAKLKILSSSKKSIPKTALALRGDLVKASEHIHKLIDELDAVTVAGVKGIKVIKDPNRYSYPLTKCEVLRYETNEELALRTATHEQDKQNWIENKLDLLVTAKAPKPTRKK